MSAKKSVLHYESSLDTATLELQKLEQAMAGGTTSYMKVPVFDGITGVEGLLHIKERFRSAATYLLFTTGDELFDNFQLCLRGDPLDEWNNNTVGIVGAARTTAAFDQELSHLYLLHCDSRACNNAQAWLETVKKPRSATCRAHGSRMKTLVRHAHMLPGTSANWNNTKMMEVIFMSFPEDWRDEFEKSNDIGAVSLQEMLTFMWIYLILWIFYMYRIVVDAWLKQTYSDPMQKDVLMTTVLETMSCSVCTHPIS